MLNGELVPEDRVVVAGTARRGVAADRAVWALVVTESGDAPGATFTRCGERLDALTQALRDALGDAADIRTGALSVQPQRDPDGQRTARIEVSGQVTIDVPVGEAGRAAGAAMAAGADRLNGPNLEVGEREAIAEELLGEAVAAARRKAERIAEAAGRRLGHVVSVTEDEDVRPYARLGRAHVRARGRTSRRPTRRSASRSTSCSHSRRKQVGNKRPRAAAHDARVSWLRARGWEYVAALAACAAFAWFVSRRLLEPDVFSDDALVHQFWMWRWRDPELFTDGLTAELMRSARYPAGYEALIRRACRSPGRS